MLYEKLPCQLKVLLFHYEIPLFTKICPFLLWMGLLGYIKWSFFTIKFPFSNPLPSKKVIIYTMLGLMKNIDKWMILDHSGYLQDIPGDFIFKSIWAKLNCLHELVVKLRKIWLSLAPLKKFTILFVLCLGYVVLQFSFTAWKFVDFLMVDKASGNNKSILTPETTMFLY